MQKTKFKQTEIGFFPEDWSESSLGELGEVVGGGTPSTKEEKYYKGNIPWITPKDLSNHKEVYIEKGERSITKEGLENSSAKLMPEETVLFTSRAPVGYVAIAKNPVSTNQGFKSIICGKTLYNRFLYYWFRYNKDRIESMAAGSTFKEVSGGTLKTIKIILPEFVEQEDIAKMLFDLDSKIEVLQQQNETLESIGRALFKHWFVDFEFPNEKGKPYKSSGGAMVDSELGEIPKGWKILKMEKIVADKKFSIVDGPFGTQLHSEEYVEEGIPVIRVINLSFKGRFDEQKLVCITEDKFKSLIRSAIYPGDILLAKTGATIGKMARCPSFIVKGIVASSVMKISPNPEKHNKHFIFNIIKNLSNQKYWESISGSSTRPTVNIPDIKELEILYPTDSLMKQYNALIDPMYSKMEINEHDIYYLSRIRDSLLPKLMTGKVRVPVEVHS